MQHNTTPRGPDRAACKELQVRAGSSLCLRMPAVHPYVAHHVQLHAQACVSLFKGGAVCDVSCSSLCGYLGADSWHSQDPQRSCMRLSMETVKLNNDS